MFLLGLFLVALAVALAAYAVWVADGGYGRAGGRNAVTVLWLTAVLAVLGFVVAKSR